MDEGKAPLLEGGVREESAVLHGRSRWFVEVWDVIKLLLIAAVIVFPIRYFIAQPFIVRGASMEPNFHDREYLVIDEVSYYFRPPHRGEAVIFRYPRDTTQFFIKRIIGLPGEYVEVKEGKVTIAERSGSSGVTLDEPYLDPPERPTYPDVRVTLDGAHYFVLGDNRDFSSDSRVWGALDRKFLVGRALFRVWPLGKFGFLPDYAVQE